MKHHVHCYFRHVRFYDSSRYEVKDTTSYCNKLVKLNRRQLAFCRKKPKVVRVLEDGFKQGINACAEKFKNNSYTRWNCTNTAKASRSNVFFGIPLAVGMYIIFLRWILNEGIITHFNFIDSEILHPHSKGIFICKNM